ncbi:nucleotide-binding domain-containing protein [Legionella pneumophila]
MQHIKTEISKLLGLLGESLDASESIHEKAIARYKSVGLWLNREQSLFYKYSPSIYLQGSFQLGTVTKIIGSEDEYDIDIVCELNLSKKEITQKQLKLMLGQEIKSYAKANNMLSPAMEGRRCWTLNYADEAQFHIDNLPALSVNQPEMTTHGAIYITDTASDDYDQLDAHWLISNPKGYAIWFEKRSNACHSSRLSATSAEVHVPEYKTKTPLQRIVQILKRHRDIMFANDPEHKPISMIITTLAAHAYNGEDDIFQALLNIIEKMPSFILSRNHQPIILNPVNPLENFADKWGKHPEREKQFYIWLKQIKADISSILLMSDLQSVLDFFKVKFGERAVNEAEKKLFEQTKTISSTINANQHLGLFSVPYRQNPLWPIQEQGTVTIIGRIQHQKQLYRFDSNSTPLSKNADLNFLAETNILPPFNVYWQVVNTGEEAQNAKQLRGDITLAKNFGCGGLNQKEKTLYKGAHCIQCFIVKNNICVARSKEFIVNVN